MPAPPLPETAAELVRLIGHGPALALCRALGGAAIRFGGPLAPQIIEIIGAESHAVLLHTFGAERVEIPRCHALLRRALRDQALQPGLSGNQAALQAGVTRRTITHWRREARAVASPTSPDLFD